MITDEDATQIIGYIQTVQNNNPSGGLSLGNMGPVTEGLWAWVVGIGGLAVIATWIASKGARSK